MLSNIACYQRKIVYFVQEVELEVGIIPFSGQKIAENQFYKKQTNRFGIFISQLLSFIGRLAFFVEDS